MISLTEETLIPLRDVPAHLPPRPGGKRIHVSAVYRWTQRGVQGIRLETIRVGGTTYTSVEALQRFADALTPETDDAVDLRETPRARLRQIGKASEQLRSVLNTGSA